MTIRKDPYDWPTLKMKNTRGYLRQPKKTDALWGTFDNLWESSPKHQRKFLSHNPARKVRLQKSFSTSTSLKPGNQTILIPCFCSTFHTPKATFSARAFKFPTPRSASNNRQFMEPGGEREPVEPWDCGLRWSEKLTSLIDPAGFPLQRDANKKNEKTKKNRSIYMIWLWLLPFWVFGWGKRYNVLANPNVYPNFYQMSQPPSFLELLMDSLLLSQSMFRPQAWNSCFVSVDFCWVPMYESDNSTIKLKNWHRCLKCLGVPFWWNVPL